MQQSRKIFIGGNWKCNNTLTQTENLIQTVYNKLQFDENKIDVICAPISLHIPFVQEHLKKTIQIGLQNLSHTPMGAYTGEISCEQAVDFNISWCIIGHSERRQYQNETDETVAKKVQKAVQTGLKVIWCVGEKLEHREAGTTFQVLKEQLDKITPSLKNTDFGNIVVAYEPVWAIGTGKVATPEQAQEVHKFIRDYLKENVGENEAKNTRIIYGGSVTDKNAKELIQQQDIDGFLIGGASLKIDFLNIVNICNQE